MTDIEKNGEPSSPRRSETSSDDDEDFGMGLGDLLPEPESPVRPPFSFSTYRPPNPLLFPDGRGEMIIRLVGSHPLWGHHLWNTARVNSDYILSNLSLVKDKKVLEFGAGAGLPALSCALGGAEQVVITDYPDQSLVDNMIWNADVNLPDEVRERVEVEGYVWGAKVDKLLEYSGGEGYDLLILSDLVFNHSQHPALVSSVNSLLSKSPDACILIFITHHRPRFQKADMDFFRVLCESPGGWGYERVVEEYTGPMFEEDPGDEKVRGTVHGFRAWRTGSNEVSKTDE